MKSTSPPRRSFPFTAVCGLEEASRALLAVLIDPLIGGVLISGEKGAGKSTLVRAVSELLPETNLCTLPLNATPESVAGTLNLAGGAAGGETGFSPGLLSRADGHILYIDEVNLLSPAVGKMVLDAASSGICRVEREGMSKTVRSRFILIGTMNPEEGPVPPQFLDRFGLYVRVEGAKNGEIREQIVRRRIAFDRDPEEVCTQFARQEEALRARLRRANAEAESVFLPEDAFEQIAGVAESVNARGHRGDIAAARTARAFAALDDRKKVETRDIEEAVRYSYPHRMGVSVSDSQETRSGSGTSEDQSLNRGDGGTETEGAFENGRKQPAEASGIEGLDVSEELLRCAGPAEDEIFAVGAPRISPKQLLPPGKRETAFEGLGRRDLKKRSHRTGKYIGYRFPKGKPSDIAVGATIRAAVPYQRVRRERSGTMHRPDRRIILHPSDIREKIRERRSGAVIFFCVDGSGSMAVNRRMEETKGAVFTLLMESYRKRDTIGMVVFRNRSAELVLPPTRSVHLAYRLLKDLPVGGATPLAEGLKKTAELAFGIRAKNEGSVPYVVLVTDGKNNSPDGERQSDGGLTELAARLSMEPIRFALIDTESGWVRLGKGKRLADNLHAEYVHLDDFRREEIVRTVGGIVGGSV
jgi:magnesium chelatase subunit D